MTPEIAEKVHDTEANDSAPTAAELQKYVCWQENLLETVLDPDALQLPEAYFLAVHSHRLLRRADKTNIRATLGDPAVPENLLAELLNPNSVHVQAVVIGTSGAGKSHLIRWLSVCLPPDPNRRVVLIEKVGTNLRGVLERILDGMDGPAFDPYRQRLNQAATSLSAEHAPQELLHQLALATGTEGRYANEILEDDDAQDDRDSLIKNLPLLLRDPAFQRQWQVAHPIVGQLVQHAVGSAGRERREERRAFSESDLDIHNWQMNANDLNIHARMIYGRLRTLPNVRRNAVEWMNRNLDEAFHRLLHFSSTALGELLVDVRAELHQQNKELILLIEDFAKLQGIDYELLDALTVRPDQGAKKLCRLRSVIAMTTGYYQRIPETYRTRETLVYDVDLEEDSATGAADREDTLVPFAARYLNAIRLDAARLTQWSAAALAEAQTGVASSDPAPSACENCPRRAICHETFGASADGYGLYPYTEKALTQMYRRGAQEETFNPRRLLGTVLKMPLRHCTPDVRTGTFPPPALLSAFGAGEMAPLQRQQLERSVGRERLERYRVLYELWGDSQTLSGVPDGVFRAFGLTRPTLSSAPPVSPPTVINTTPNAPPAPLPSAFQSGLDQISGWQNGGVPAQPLLGALRPLLFNAVKNALDWNTLSLSAAYHSNTGRAFSNESFDLEGQTTQAGHASVKIVLSRRDALGLQAFLYFNQYKDWNFKDATDYCVAYAELLADAAAQVEAQLQRAGEPEPYDPSASCAVALAGHVLARGDVPLKEWLACPTPEEHAGLLFQKIAAPPAAITSVLPARNPTNRERLLKDIRERDAGRKMRDCLLARIACLKGSGAAQILDAARVLPALTEFCRDWKPALAIPQGESFAGYEFLRRDFNAFVKFWHPMVAEETAAMNEQIQCYRGFIPQNETADAIRLLKSTAKLGVEMGKLRDNASAAALTRLLRIVDGSEMESAFATAETGAADAQTGLPAALDPALRRILTQGVELVTAADKTLTHTLSHVEMELAPLGGGAGSKRETLIRDVEAGLTLLPDCLTEIETMARAANQALSAPNAQGV